MIENYDVVYKEVDPAKKNGEWIDKVVTALRMNWGPYVDKSQYHENRDYLFSRQSLQNVINSFKDKTFIAATRFEPLGLWEDKVNTLVEELTKTPPKAEIKAVDPSALRDKSDDIKLLKGRKIIEQDLSKYQNQVGLPGYKVPYSKFNGNAEKFDKMGLDANSPDDMNFYEENIQLLNYEIATQALVKAVMETNRFDQETIRKFVADILCARKICFQTYVDKITGEIKYNYIHPDRAMGIFGESNDGHNDICRGWMEPKTIMEFLQMVGNDFDFKRDFHKLLEAINFHGAGAETGYQPYSGFTYQGNKYDARMYDSNIFPKKERLLDWNEASKFKIHVGFMEFNTVEATDTYLRSRTDPDFAEHITYSQGWEYDNKYKDQETEYYSESFYQQQWYSAYFFSTSALSQRIFNWSKVYYQQFSGANDEYAAGTTVYYRESGKPAVEVVKSVHDVANFAFYRLWYVIYKAKPEEDVYIYDELIEIAKHIKNKVNQNSKTVPGIEGIIGDAIQYQKANNTRIRSYPTIDGRKVAQLPPLDTGKRNGVDPISIAMQAVMDWAENLSNRMLGWNPMRSGMNPPARESNDSETATINSSQNATGYIYRMIQFMKERTATTTLQYGTDIIKFKESVPYKWIKSILGNENFDALPYLDKIAAHRYALFIRDYNSNFDKRKVLEQAEVALAQRLISFDQWFMITQTDDLKAAAKMLGFLKNRTEKILRQQKIQDDKTAHDYRMQEIKAQEQVEFTKANGAIERENIAADAIKYSADRQYDAKIDVKDMTNKNEPEKQAAKTESQKEILEAKANAEKSEAYPAYT